MSLRVIFQRVQSASLRHSEEDPEQKIGKGLVFYICIGGNATEKFITKTVEKLMKSSLWKNPETNRASTLENIDIMIVPQASMGGKLKGKKLQYHSNIAKDKAEELFHLFCSQVKEKVEQMNAESEFTPTVVLGEYSKLQMLQVNSEIGPNTHFLEFSAE